ncbi:MAG TPA: insulinase family protein [Ktedonobacter sp.]|jgi:predicted Zn-dependent peptidase|nr:insulinase family protein [Ktedonobacter sp.]HAG99234.1 insulinase family protein [Ktedonobacter sp.]HAT46542.1 insulinase family protein [Ktedonobacter sp.]HBE24991.1 insulinase family protein [Ktedonobacter sp.]HBE27510.1 insulinase family protein [Ktedonobacter sp.]
MSICFIWKHEEKWYSFTYMIYAEKATPSSWMNYKRTTLHNGLRVLTAQMPGMRSASIGFFLTVGSRYEADSIAGISHFIEHMLFKGSRHYPTARLISEAIEGVGGVFNGSTGKEITSYTARVPGEQLPIVMNVMADMIRYPLFDPTEIEKERGVIVEELSSTRDDPQEWANLLIDEVMWPSLPLGRDDAGFVETVTQIERQQMLDYMDEHYRPGSLTISVAGNIDHEQVIKEAERIFSDWEPRAHPRWKESLPPRDTLPIAMIRKETEQTNVCLATLGASYSSPDYYPILLINAILGDGMSSRLFQSIREEQGLAYDIGSYFNSYSDTGSMVISAGVDPSQTESAVRAIIHELNQLCENPVPADELDRVKAYVRGGFLLGLEGTQQVASWLGGQESLRNKIIDIDEMVALVDAVTSQDIQRVAQFCFAPAWRRLAIIGPDDTYQAERFGELLKGD